MKFLWELPLENKIANKFIEDTAIKNYFKELGNEVNELLENVSSSCFRETVAKLNAIDEKYRLLFFLLSEVYVDETTSITIIEEIENNYKQTFFEQLVYHSEPIIRNNSLLEILE
ncbi:hypothetical protein D920_00315 [Enterococcus faecalis 13-SD-W-01]|nr:hypothetical protein D920_00315 [Enterococcus faecalis 13-SD-W-01]